VDKDVGLDIDGVLANFIEGFLEKGRALGLGEQLPPHWTRWTDWNPVPEAVFGQIWSKVEEDFHWWMRLGAYDDAYVGYPVAGYVTSRPVPSEISGDWLQSHGFPPAPITTVGPGQSKAEAVEEMGLDVFVDDREKNVKELSRDSSAEVFVLDRPWNQGAQARRISNVSELADRLS
jgi:hypothetical protein